MTKEFTRKLIEVEIRLGFLSIPSQGVHLMPDEKASVVVKLEGEDKPKRLTYNAEYRRMFGLTAWYKKNKAKPKDEVIIEKVKDFPPNYNLKFQVQEEFEKAKEAKKLIDLSGLSTTNKGDIVEDRIKELVLLHGQGLLSVYRPVSDTEGVDLIITKSGMYQPLFLQVKGRFNLQKTGAFIMDIRKKTFNPHHSYFVVGAYFNPETLEINDHLLFVPSVEIPDNAVEVNKGRRYRVTTHLNPESKSKWSPYIIDKTNLAEMLLEKFEEMGRYIK